MKNVFHRNDDGIINSVSCSAGFVSLEGNYLHSVDEAKQELTFVFHPAYTRKASLGTFTVPFEHNLWRAYVEHQLYNKRSASEYWQEVTGQRLCG